MSNLIQDVFKDITSPGPRTQWLKKWLLENVWSPERYNSMTPSEYLKQGEFSVNELEEIIASAAYRLYDEFLGEITPERDVSYFLQNESPCAVVIFDGLSVREIPVLLRLAERSNLVPREVSASFSSLPTETLDFIQTRLRLGNTPPSQLPRKRELRERGVIAYYYDNPNQQYQLNREATKLLLWSAFPDNTYSDSGARFVEHFEQIHALLEPAWLNTVQQIPPGCKILVTSDHGYVFFGHGLSFPRKNDFLRPLSEFLGGERYKRLTDTNDTPPQHPDLMIYPSYKVAVIRGRVQTHPPGKSAARLYKHGGLSIMEMLVPWVILERKP